MKKFNQDFVPSTLNEAIDYLYSELDTKDIDYIKSQKSGSVHFSLGMYLRNNWSLWEEGTPFKKDIQTRFGIWGMGDDCSGLILEGLWAKVNGEDVDAILTKTAERFKKHWIKSGIDPATGKEIPGSKPRGTIKYRINKKTGEIEEDEG
jgi:hypothetical protein